MTYIQGNNWDVEIVWPDHVLSFVTICKLILPLPVLSTRWWNVSLVEMFLIYYYTCLSFSWFLTCLIWHTIVFSSILDTMLPIICYYRNETTINTWVCFIVEILYFNEIRFKMYNSLFWLVQFKYFLRRRRNSYKPQGNFYMWKKKCLFFFRDIFLLCIPVLQKKKNQSAFFTNSSGFISIFLKDIHNFYIMYRFHIVKCNGIWHDNMQQLFFQII